MATRQTEPNEEPSENGHEQEVPEVLASLELLMSKVKEKQDRPPIKYRDQETGLTFHLRELTGEDIERISSLAGADEAKYMRMIAERASVQPKIDLLTWEALGKLG